MTLEQAMEVLISRYNSGVIRSRTNDDEWRLATDTVIAALRGPEPDPDTGLVPCGCGGKANLYHNDYIYGDHQEGCWAVFCSNTCGIETSDLTSEKAAKETWNTAMGYHP
jgi:hypothetical protein